MPNSLDQNVPPRLGLLSQGTCVGSGYGPSVLLFTGSRIRPAYTITPSLLSLHYGSPEASTLGQAGSSRLAYPEASELDGGAGILTSFPFDGDQLGTILGPTDPWLTNMAMEPLPFRRSGFSPDYATTTARILVTEGSTRAYASGFYAISTPSYRITFRCPRVSAVGFSPVHFRCPESRLVSCYALFKGWLLLSLPSSCLRPETSFIVYT